MWLQDGWSAGEKQIVEAVRSAGADSPIISVFIPRQSADDLRRLLIEAEAARQTLDAKGNPTTAEGLGGPREHGEQAQQGGRRSAIDCSAEIVANSKVFQGGGNELLNPQLDERIRTAADDALVRLFPRFKDADSKAWETVIKRAREGADQPFQPTGYAGATEKHPVCQQVSTTIGAGKVGAEIRKVLRASPFGWPQDAIDAALIALAPAAARLGHAEWRGGPARPAGSEQDLQGRIPGREVAAYRAGSVEDPKAHHPARRVQERRGGDEGSGIPRPC